MIPGGVSAPQLPTSRYCLTYRLQLPRSLYIPLYKLVGRDLLAKSLITDLAPFLQLLPLQVQEVPRPPSAGSNRSEVTTASSVVSALPNPPVGGSQGIQHPLIVPSTSPHSPLNLPS